MRGLVRNSPVWSAPVEKKGGREGAWEHLEIIGSSHLPHLSQIKSGNGHLRNNAMKFD